MTASWEGRRLRKKTSVQSATEQFWIPGVSPSHIPQPGFRMIQYVEAKPGCRQNTRNPLLLLWGVRKEIPNVQSEGNSVFLLFSPFFHTLAPRQSRHSHRNNGNCGGNVAAGTTLQKRGGFLPIRGAVGPKTAGQACCFPPPPSMQGQLEEGCARVITKAPAFCLVFWKGESQETGKYRSGHGEKD